MRLLIASNNAHKAREIKEILGAYFEEILTLREAGIHIEVEEDGTTFTENAVKKALGVMEAAEAFDAVLADDSGLQVDALHGAPGVYSARFAGDGHDDGANNRKLMEEMTGIPREERTCRFVSAVALARKGRDVLTAEGTVEGILLTGPQGENGFGYDPYFYYPPFEKSFAELTAEEKNSVSHRKRSLETLRKLLEAER